MLSRHSLVGLPSSRPTFGLFGLQGDLESEPRHFGVRVSALTSEKNSVPIVMEKLLEYVEMHGLYTEGIYRKSGSANRMRELKQFLQMGKGAYLFLLKGFESHLAAKHCNQGSMTRKY